MIVCKTISDLREQRNTWQQQNKTVGLVPTMGNLHAGHLSLIHTLKPYCDKIIVSIYVNPLQFAPNEDFASYPRTLADDLASLSQLPVDAVFTPDDAQLYPNGKVDIVNVRVPELGSQLCGVTRPHFFHGVATVVTKLFNIVQPNYAVFGEKDYQQLLIIRALVRDLNLPVEVISSPIIREDDGLAMSSRNRYLVDEYRHKAVQLQQTLQSCKQKILSGMDDFSQLEQQACAELAENGFIPDYVAVRTQQDLQIPKENKQQLIVLSAATIGSTRLIDNLKVN